MRLIIISLLLLSFYGCSAIDFIKCGDAGVCSCDGLFCTEPICNGDDRCKDRD